MPLQSTTDCGSETTDVYGFANALRCVITCCFVYVFMSIQ
jgi:hypothetical protein